MTTLIAKDGELFGDRRKVINYLRNGIIGIRNEPKIIKLPFCLYGLSGYDLAAGAPNKDAIQERFEHKLAVICALDYFGSELFLKHAFHKAFKNLPNFRSFVGACIRLRNKLGKALAKDLQEQCAHLIMLTHSHTFVIDNASWLQYDNNETLIIGAGKKAAAIFIDHNLPMSELYYALRSQGCPTGPTFDRLSVKEDLGAAFPPICDEDFLQVLTFFSKATFRKELRAEAVSKEEYEENLEGLAKIVAAFLTMGELKDNTFYFSDKPNFDYDSEEAKQSSAWKAAVAITAYKPAKERK